MSSNVFGLIDLIEDIKKVDEMIALHNTDAASPDAIMLSQYEAKKVKLTSHLLSQLTSPPFSSTSSLLFIKRFLEKYYAEASHPVSTDKQTNEIRQLESVL